MSTLATEADALAIELLESAEHPHRVMLIAGQLAVLAGRLHEQEAAAVPEHLRAAPRALPPEVVKLCGRRVRP